MDWLLVISILILVSAERNLGEVSEVFEVRIFTNDIANKTKDASIIIKLYGRYGDSLGTAIPTSSASNNLVSHFGQIGLDVYNVTVTPAIGSPTKIRITQQDPLKQMIWNLNKVLVIDSKAFYYEFLVDKLLNSSSTPNGEVSEEVLLSRSYGGPNTVQSRGCMDNGSKIWYRDQLGNSYKSGIIIGLNASNATFTTASGGIVTVPRGQHYDSSSGPLVVNDDWLELTMSLKAGDMFIAAFNQTGQFYYGRCTHVSSSSVIVMMSNYKTIWGHLVFYIHYTDGEVNYVRAGNIRRVNKLSTSFCTDQEPDNEDDPKASNVLFTCEGSRQRLVHHVIKAISARDVMHCGMICSRHAQCVSFNFCAPSSHPSCRTPLNCELYSSKDGISDGEGFQFCVLLKKF